MPNRHISLAAPAVDQSILSEAPGRARALLHRNLTPFGILAATAGTEAKQRHYTSIFGRDAGICALAMAHSGDPQLVQGAWQGLETLAAHQAPHGQIPKYVDPEAADSDFWYVGCIDATLWWLVALHFLSKLAPDPVRMAATQETAGRALTWLRCQEHPRLQLLTQNEASDWADIMPRSGFVLYSNTLWYYVKRLYGISDPEITRHHFNHLFHPFSRDLPEYRRLRLLTHYIRRTPQNRDLYLSFVNFSFFGEEGDVFGNLLAVLLGLANDVQSGRILRTLQHARIDHPDPVRVTLKPISQKDPLWRSYMGRHRQNYAHQYHNGGAWPFVGGFWVMALAARDQKQAARAAYQRLVEANARNDWSFQEWFNGKTGEAGGMKGQSWNAAMLLLAHQALESPVF